MKNELILAEFQNSFVAHFSKFFREGTAIQVEIICQFLSVKRNLKDRAFGFGRLRGQIDQQTSPDGLWGCAENPVGQDEIFVNGNSKEILHDLAVQRVS